MEGPAYRQGAAHPRSGSVRDRRDLHDALDAAVADAYGWSPIEREALILERLVALHDARLEEEHYGTIRWLREAFQKSQGRSGGVVTMALDDEKDDETQEPSREIWPTDVIDQITAIRRLLVAEPQTQESLRSSLVGARRDLTRATPRYAGAPR